MIDKGRKKQKRVFFLLFLQLLILISAVNVYAFDAVSAARNNVIETGDWSKDKDGIRYAIKEGKYIHSVWCYIDGHVYRFDDKGYVKTGIFSYDDKQYISDHKGRLYLDQLVKIGKRTYYCQKNGKVLTHSWKTIGKKKVHFDRNGIMVTNSWVKSRYVGEDGDLLKGKKLDQELKKRAEKTQVVIIGASRIAQMERALRQKEELSSRVVFISRYGEGLTWLKTRASVILKKYLNNNPDIKVVFMLGNNDCYKINQYISYYRSLMKKYPDTNFYFMDALPCDGEKEHHNSKNQYFNDRMLVEFGDQCIGGFDYLSENGFETIDGVHYTPNVYLKIYSYIMKQIRK